MANYTIISEVGKALTNILKDKLVPEPIDKPEKIGICEPKDRGEYVVGIHPYDIKEDLTSQKRLPIKLPDGREQDPPSLVELYYMISISSKSEIEVRSAEESRIIGKIIQIFKDNQTIPNEYLESSAIESIPISMIPLEMEEKVKIWTMFGESYKLSVFYLVGPVAIDSEIVRKPQKVETVILETIQRIPRKIVQFETRIKEEDIDDEYTQDYAPEEEEEESEDDDFDMDSEDESSDEFLDEEGEEEKEEESDESEEGEKSEDSNENLDDLLNELDEDEELSEEKKEEPDNSKDEKSEDDESEGEQKEEKGEDSEKNLDNLLKELDEDEELSEEKKEEPDNSKDEKLEDDESGEKEEESDESEKEGGVEKLEDDS